MVIDAAMSLVSFRFAFLFLLAAAAAAAAAAAVSCAAILSSIKTWSEMDRDVQYTIFCCFQFEPNFCSFDFFFFFFFFNSASRLFLSVGSFRRHQGHFHSHWVTYLIHNANTQHGSLCAVRCSDAALFYFLALSSLFFFKLKFKVKFKKWTHLVLSWGCSQGQVKTSDGQVKMNPRCRHFVFHSIIVANLKFAQQLLTDLQCE